MKIKKLNESKESKESELITQYINNGEFDKLEKVHNGTNVVWKLKDNNIKESIEVETIGDYITDHYEFDDIDDKYSCINSIRDSFKDEKTISKEELEQFIGSHNGKDKIDESKYQDISNVDLDNELVQDLVVRAFDYNQAQCLVDNDIEYAKHLAYDNVSEEEIAKAEEYLASKGCYHQINESKATHCVYFDQDGIEQIEFEGTEDECQNYIASIEAEQDDEFGDEAPERFVKRLDESMKDYRFEVSCNDGPKEVVKLIWDEKDIDGAKEMAKKYYAQGHTTYADDRENRWTIEESLEENVQYGVHQFSTDSIIFRGSEEECGRYIDNNKDLWDDAEVYKMTTDDVHYKKELDESVDTAIEEGPKEGPEFGLSSLLNEAIQEELKTVDFYNSIAITARDTGYEDIAKLVDEINTEENKHIGQLQEALKSISPNAIAIEDGTAEGQEQLSNMTIFDDDFSDEELGLALFKLR